MLVKQIYRRRNRYQFILPRQEDLQVSWQGHPSSLARRLMVDLYSVTGPGAPVAAALYFWENGGKRPRLKQVWLAPGIRWHSTAQMYSIVTLLQLTSGRAPRPHIFCIGLLNAYFVVAIGVAILLAARVTVIVAVTAGGCRSSSWSRIYFQ